MTTSNADVLAKLDRLTDLVTARFDAMQAQLAAQGDRLSRMEGRIEEQSRTLGALIPTTLAAVPARPAAAG